MAMIIGAKLPRFLWPEVVQTVVYLTNRSPTSINSQATPSLTSLQEAMKFNINANMIIYVHMGQLHTFISPLKHVHRAKNSM